MNISRKWLKEFVDITATDKEYDEIMTIAGQKVETTTRMDEDIKNVVVGKVLSMAIVDRALRARELEERIVVPSQIPEFVLLHSDSVEASGFVQHIKLPHYVDFQAQLSLIRGLRAKSGKKEENQE